MIKQVIPGNLYGMLRNEIILELLTKSQENKVDANSSILKPLIMLLFDNNTKYTL